MTRADGLTVVVANRADRVEEAATAIEAFRRELDPQLDQLVWVDRGRRRCPPGDPPTDSVVGPAGADRGTCYGLGLAAVDRPPSMRAEHAAIVARARQAREAYGRLALRARRGDDAGYRRSVSAVGAAELAFARALRRTSARGGDASNGP